MFSSNFNILHEIYLDLPLKYRIVINGLFEESTMEQGPPREKVMSADALKVRGPEIYFDSDEQRSLIEEAAKSRGLTMTAFIRSSALKEANDILKQSQLLLVSDRDWDILTQLIETPPKPNEALKKLLKP